MLKNSLFFAGGAAAVVLVWVIMAQAKKARDRKAAVELEAAANTNGAVVVKPNIAPSTDSAESISVKTAY